MVAKLPQKRTRQYIYDLLTKLKIQFKHIERIVERRGGMVDFTCNTIGQAQHLAAALLSHKDVEFATTVLSEYTVIKVHWVPGRFPNERIISAIERHHGKVHETRILRDRYGFGDGRRTYRVKTDDLKESSKETLSATSTVQITVSDVGAQIIAQSVTPNQRNKNKLIPFYFNTVC